MSPTMTTATSSVSLPAESHAGLAIIDLALLTGGFDGAYAFDLAMSLVERGVRMDVIGSDEVDRPEWHATPAVRFLNLQGSRRLDVGLLTKIGRVLRYYLRLMRYALTAKPKIFHVLWNGKLQHFDRTFLMLYYKSLGKKVVFHAHNVNAAKRDGVDTALNRLTLKSQYRLANHIFVHTAKMKEELQQDFGVVLDAVTVIPHGVNNAVPDTDLTSAEARQRLGLAASDKAILFFGNIGPYKGLDLLIAAFQRLVAADPSYCLIIAGKARGGTGEYLDEIRRSIADPASRGRILPKIEYIPDEENEVYFKAADVLALPYREIYQSGVLFLGYSFGLPVVATDVGSFREDVREGETGFLCAPNDPTELAKALQTFFESTLYRNLDVCRQQIRDYVRRGHSWDTVGGIIRDAYDRLLNPDSASPS